MTSHGVSTHTLTPQETVELALSASTTDGCVVIVTDRTEANLRWANNTLTTNGEMRSRRVAVISVHNGATGTSVGVLERNAVTREAIGGLVANADAAARQASPAEDAMPLLTPAESVATTGWDEDPAETSAAVFGDFAPALGEAFGTARAAGNLLFGFAEHVMESTFLGSSTGLRLRHDQPAGRLELNAKSSDLARSAWSGAATRDFGDIDVTAAQAQLARRLEWANTRIDLPAGRYETILPPTAVADLMIYLYWMANARDADEGRTVFSRRGGGSRIGERLAELPLRLFSDPNAAGVECAPFLAGTTSGSAQSVFDNGMPVPAMNWIDGGVLANLHRPRSWARRAGAPAVAPVDNLLLSAPGATATEEQLVAGVERGLLLTCLWYIRLVDPRSLLLTGLTRDGVYLVEGGEVVGVVNNFRFNESPVSMLGRIAEIGRSEITLPREWGDYFTRASMPAIRVADFNMSTVSPGV